MKREIQKSIDEYVELYAAIQEKTGNDEIAVAILQEIGRDKRTTEIASFESGVLATEKQKKCMTDLGLEFQDFITKKEASNMISEKLNKA